MCMWHRFSCHTKSHQEPNRRTSLAPFYPNTRPRLSPLSSLMNCNVAHICSTFRYVTALNCHNVLARITPTGTSVSELFVPMV